MSILSPLTIWRFCLPAPTTTLDIPRHKVLKPSNLDIVERALETPVYIVPPEDMTCIRVCVRSVSIPVICQFSNVVGAYLHQIHWIHDRVFLRNVSSVLVLIIPQPPKSSLQLYQQMRLPTCYDQGRSPQVEPHIYHSSALSLPFFQHATLQLNWFLQSYITHSYSSPGTASGLPCVCRVIFSADGTSAAGRDACVATLTCGKDGRDDSRWR